MTANVTDIIDCPDCVKDSFDPFSRRYRYSFNQCSGCAPNAVSETECQLCLSERRDSKHRHFGFKGNSCYHCGSNITLTRADNKPICLESISQLDEVDGACNLLKNGELVVIQTLSAFYLACDASKDDPVKSLRKGVHQPTKSLPLMARDLDIITQYCQISKIERNALINKVAPIVVLDSCNDNHLQQIIAPGKTTLDFKLPYTPILQLLMSKMSRPIVLFNLEKIVPKSKQIKQKLAKVAGYFLLHNHIMCVQSETVLKSNNQQLTVLHSGGAYLELVNQTQHKHKFDDALNDHHTHIVSCLMQHQQGSSNNKVLAFILDGVIATKENNDLGCEFMLANSEHCQHVGRFSRPINYVTNKQNWHATYAHILSSLGWAEYQMNFEELPLSQLLHKQALDDFTLQIKNNNLGISSCLMLFEAVAVAIGLDQDKSSHAAQAIYALEEIIDQDTLENEHDSLIYPFAIPVLAESSLPYIEPITVWRAILGDLIVQTPAGVISARFHLGLAKAIVKMIHKLSHKYDERLIDTVILSSGLFEHSVLLRLVTESLLAQEFKILRPHIAIKNKPIVDQKEVVNA